MLAGAAGAFAEVRRQVVPVDESARARALARHDRLAKPQGSLGALERLGARLAAVAGTVPPPVPEPAALAVFAGDHGVLAQGVSPWPADVTTHMVWTMASRRAVVNAIARQIGVDVTVVDVGVAADVGSAPALVDAKVRRGTRDLSAEPAMTLDEVVAALDAGAAVGRQLVGTGARCLLTGEMGIGNTTPAAALVAAYTDRPAAATTGRGTGIDDDTFGRKVALVDGALRTASARGDLDDPLATLAALGGLELAALAGYAAAGAAARVPVVVDGVIAAAAALAAVRLVPAVAGYLVAGHRSSEPGSSVALDALGLEPVLDLGLRLGEGSGACLALPVVQAAARVLAETATLDEVLRGS